MTVFEAYITNLGKYAEGQLVGETLKFPATTEEVQSLLKNIGVDGVRYEEFFITAFDGDVMGLYDYVFIGWAFLKLGTAYRLAAGSDFAHKFIGLGQTVGAAFADFAPSLALFDWLVGIVGAVAFRLLIYFKSKNAKKYRRDAEYGSARWSA
jgi:hypothetical protein